MTDKAGMRPAGETKTGTSVKNPEHEAEIPAPSPRDIAGTSTPRNSDPAGQQGGTEGHGKSAR